MIFLQIVMAVTGNYCFFNLLTIALCLLLIDDSVAGALRAAPHKRATNASAAFLTAEPLLDRLCTYSATPAVIVTFPINAWVIFSAFKPYLQWLGPFIPIH